MNKSNENLDMKRKRGRSKKVSSENDVVSSNLSDSEENASKRTKNEDNPEDEKNVIRLLDEDTIKDEPSTSKSGQESCETQNKFHNEEQVLNPNLKHSVKRKRSRRVVLKIVEEDPKSDISEGIVGNSTEASEKCFVAKNLLPQDNINFNEVKKCSDEDNSPKTTSTLAGNSFSVEENSNESVKLTKKSNTIVENRNVFSVDTLKSFSDEEISNEASFPSIAQEKPKKNTLTFVGKQNIVPDDILKSFLDEETTEKALVSEDKSKKNTITFDNKQNIVSDEETSNAASLVEDKSKKNTIALVENRRFVSDDNLTSKKNTITLVEKQRFVSDDNLKSFSDEETRNDEETSKKNTITLVEERRFVSGDILKSFSDEETSNEALIISDEERKFVNDDILAPTHKYVTVKDLKSISDGAYYNEEEFGSSVVENTTFGEDACGGIGEKFMNDSKSFENEKVADESFVSSIISNEGTDSDENASKRRRLPHRRERSGRAGSKKKLKPKADKLITTHKLNTDEVNQIQITMATTEKIPEAKTTKVKSEMLKNLFDTGKITYRVMKRANFVIQTVRQEKVIVDLTKLMKLIKEEEIGEGYKAAIDKKSLMRLILKLSRDGYIKFRKATLKSDSKLKTVCFICDPNIEDDHSVITSALEQSKMKFFIATKEKLKEEPMIIEEKDLPQNSKDMVKSILFRPVQEVIVEDTKEEIKYTYNRTASKSYGLCPKFVRTRIIHEILYYLIYEDTNQQPITDREEIEKVFQSHGVKDDVFEKDIFCPMYSRGLDWKMFVPPLPVHAGWSRGWTLICDVLLRLPLVIFLKCFNVPYIIPDIKPYLSHPIRKFLLVKNLPPKIRNGIMHGRRYIFSMHELVSRLCHMGLLQFGPQKLKEKDQIFLYLNKRASLYNTVTSPARYHQTEVMYYERHDYVFKSFHDLEIYWYELWTICINTQLGTRISMAGQFIVLEPVHTKPSLIEAAKPRLADEVEAYDNGEIPGDQRGAAGLDSALFAHLKRNWNWSDLLTYPEKEILKNKNKTRPLTKPTIDVNKEIEESEERENRRRLIELNKLKSKKLKVKKREAKRKKIIRQVLPIKQIKIKKTWYDEKDKICLKKMSKLRTDWTQIEDNVLLLCTVASIYLCPNRRKQNVEYTVMRDVLHKFVAYANDKTSRSCQRRIAYIMKNVKTRRSVQMCLEETRQCEYVIEKFGTILKKYSGISLPQLTLNIAFIELVVYLNQRFSNQIQTVRKPLSVLPDTIDGIKRLYEFNTNKKTVTTIFKDVDNLIDIHSDVIRSVVHSSMSCVKDKNSWAFELFKIYQQYPEALLRSVIMKIRHDQMVSVKKSFLKNTGTGCLPFSTPYQLSISYAYQLQNLRFHYNSFIEANSFLRNILNWIRTASKTDRRYEITCSDNGTSMLILDIMEKMGIDFVFEHPEQIIVLDPVITTDTMYESIIKRYNDILNDPTRISLWEEKPKENDDENDDSDVENYPKFEENQVKTVDINSAVYKKTSTRIAFHMMRAEMCEGIDKNSTQHVHDYFVVNASRVFFKIPENLKIDNKNNFDITKMQYKSNVLKILNKIKSDAIVPDSCGRITSENVRNHFPNKNLTNNDFEYIEKFKCFIANSGELGMTITALKNILPDDQEVVLSIFDILEILQKLKIVYRVGVTIPRYVHFDHKAPWLVNTDKIVRLEREKMILKDRRAIKLKGKRLIKTPSEEKTEGSEHQKIKLLMEPWIRLDGSLNRRVLDRWIGSVLSNIMEDPGISFVDLSTRFDYLKPVELLSVVENLAQLKFVRLIKIQKPKVTLFSKELDFDFEEANILDEPKDILIEPEQDAVYKFALFIGQKSYSCNFID